jgi:hypothetical protein
VSAPRNPNPRCPEFQNFVNRSSKIWLSPGRKGSFLKPFKSLSGLGRLERLSLTCTSTTSPVVFNAQAHLQRLIELTVWFTPGDYP